MAGRKERGRKRMYMERVMTIQHPCVCLPVLLLLLCCAVSSLCGPVQRVAKVGAEDVHDEQRLEDRLKVMAAMKRLQEASLPQAVREKKQTQQTGYRSELTPSSDSKLSSPGDNPPAPVTRPEDTYPSHTGSVHPPTLLSLSSEVTVQTPSLSRQRPHSETSTALKTRSEDSHNDADSHRDHNVATQTPFTNSRAEESSGSSPSRLPEVSDEHHPATGLDRSGVTDASGSGRTENGEGLSDVDRNGQNSELSRTRVNSEQEGSSTQRENTDQTGSRTEKTEQTGSGTRITDTEQEGSQAHLENTKNTRSTSSSNNTELKSSTTEKDHPKQTDSTSHSENTELRGSEAQTENKNQVGPSSQIAKTERRGQNLHPQNTDPNEQTENLNQRAVSTRVEIIDLFTPLKTSQREPPARTQSTEETDPRTQTKEEEVEEVGLLFEGDIMLSASEAEEVLHPDGNRKRRKRKVTYKNRKLWTLPIPYTFDQTPEYRLNSTEVQKVKAAIAHLEGLTCITFSEQSKVNASDPGPILSFKKDSGCWSYVGKEYGFHYQEVSTGEGCFEFGTLLHELGHAIGFWHEHSRPDREGFIRVHTERVRLGEEYNFKVESWGELDNKGVPYDVGSIMHYGSTYFARTGREITVESVDPRQQRVLGQRQEMSFYDVKLANKAYCQGVCNSTLKCLHEGYPDPKRCSHCRCPPGLSGTTCQNVAPSQGATCGGRLYVSPGQKYSISSPSFPTGYSPNVFCSWLIQTEKDRQIVVTVEKRNFMNNSRCGPYPTTVCTDYLEVKYNASFGYTGARYCCGLAPEEPLRSSGNNTLILFVTRQAGQGGFQANITVESCGGCHEGGAEPQPACRRREVTTCRKVWFVTKYVPCPVPFYTGSACNVEMKEKKNRTDHCSSEVEYCCQGFNLSNGYCHRTNSSNVTSSQGNTPTVQPSGDTGNTDIGQGDADSGWSSWLSWSACSRSCGGCGVQTRQRTCDIPTQCRGQAKEQDSRACNTFPCPELTVYRCTTTRIKDFFCGWGKCYRRVIETGPCFSTCCPGYVQVYGKCVPSNQP